MKELRIKIGLVNGQKPTEEEKETLRGTMTVLARVIDESIYRSVMKSGLDKDLYLSSLERIWYSYEEDDLEKAKEHLNKENHLFVSQFLPNVTWNAGNAIKRNALIIGLSKAMILVESGKAGGTFAAGNEALELGQPLFVVDYEKPEVSAEGNPYFLSRGGKPIRSREGRPNLDKVLSTLSETPVKIEQLKFDFVY